MDMNHVNFIVFNKSVYGSHICQWSGESFWKVGNLTTHFFKFIYIGLIISVVFAYKYFKVRILCY